MLLPTDFKDTVASTFYDKTITILNRTSSKDTEGGIVRGSTTTKGTFTGNVRFNALGELQSEIGLVESIDIAITCLPTVDVAVDDLLQYAGKRYVATDVLPYDSHKLIVGRVWQQ